MSYIQENDCPCNNRVSAGRDERGDKERCTTCGNVYLILNGEEVWLENESEDEGDPQLQEEQEAENQAELAVDEAIIEKHEQRGEL